MLLDTLYMLYDLAIIGAGPGGLSTSVYASRYGLNNVVIGGIVGGLSAQTHEIGNWLGTEKITGFEFAQKSHQHALSLGATFVNALVDEIKQNEEGFVLYVSNGEKIQTKTILIATGSKHRHLGVPGEKELFGKGVSYCATCDGFFYRGKTVAIVGGNDSAAGAAVFMSEIAQKVYVIYRGEELRAERFWIESLQKKNNIEILTNTNVKQILGTDKVEELMLDYVYNGSDKLKVDGVFVEIGSEPATQLAVDLGVEVDGEGFIQVGPDGRTNVKGIWAAGDITTGSNKFKQIITAAAEGAICAQSIQQFLKK